MVAQPADDHRAAGWYRVIYILDPTTGELLEIRNVDKDGNVAYRATELA